MRVGNYLNSKKMKKMKFALLALLIATSFGAVAQTKGVKFDPNYKGYYYLRTQFTGDELSLESNGAESPTMNGAAFMSSQKGATGQQWQFVPVAGQNGWYRLQTRLHGDKKSLEGNGKDSPVKGGASFMDNPQNVSGQFWKLEDAGNGYYRLRTMLHGDKNSLEGNKQGGSKGGNSFMDNTQNVSGQLWYLVLAN
jgi:hypothetical protein